MKLKIQHALAALLIFIGLTGVSQATDFSHSVPAVSGYDLVSYHTAGNPTHGNGHHLLVHHGLTYLFSNEENKEAFDKNPDSYLPAYGGYYAFGVSVGKKFIGDPEVWKVVDATLYLNLDKNIQADWFKDIPGRIKTADANRTRINADPATL